MSQRIDLPDIARGSLILLVVWGHLIESNGLGNSLYFSIYVFHIPAFAMVSGFLSKKKLDANDIGKILYRLLIPLLVFQGLYFMALGVAIVPERVFSLYTPAWIIWFLFSLITWKLLLPMVLKLPFPLFLSIIAALAVGFFESIGLELSLSRTFVFFPAFLFGHLYGRQIFDALNRYRIPLSVLFIAIFCAANLISDHINIGWLWGAHSYSRIPLETPGVLFRTLTIGIGIVQSIAFLAILPKRSAALAFLGRNSMQIYLLHGFAIILIWEKGFWPENNFAFLFLTAVFSLAISILIAWLSRLLISRFWQPT